MKKEISEYLDKKNKKVFIVAEIGKNFIQNEEERPVKEYLKNALSLIDESVKAGVDAVKFQTHNVEDEQLDIQVISPHFKGKDRYNWVKQNTEATPLNEFWLPLKEYCDKKGIIFFSTPMSRGAAKILDEVGVGLWKVGSGDILDFVMLDYLRSSQKPIIVSLGMSTLEEIGKALDFLRAKNNNIALLHCVSKYPCKPEELNLKTIEFLKERFDIPIGFSDHSIEVEPSLVAVAMGAKIIEKHFSFSRDLWGADHKVSLTPREMQDLVKRARELEKSPVKKKKVLASALARKSFGEKRKILQEGEAVFRPLFRKSLVAGCDIPAKSKIASKMLYAMRPQQYCQGLVSEKYEEVVGQTVIKKLKKYEPITTDVLE